MIPSGTLITDRNRAEWLAERRNSLGASEAAAAFGASPYDTPIGVWQRKVGKAPEVVENEAMRWGSILEPLVLDEYQRRTGRAVMARQLFVRHSDYPFLTATLDGLTACQRVVEVKCVSAYAKEWGNEDSDEIPTPYLIQVAQQLVITGAEVADVAVLVGGQRLRVYTVERNPELLKAVTLDGGKFWEHVETRTPPDWGVKTAADLLVLHPGCDGEVQLDADVQADVDEYARLRYEIKRLENDCDLVKTRVLGSLLESKRGALPDGRVVTRHVQEVAERTQTVKAYTRHYWTVKGRSVDGGER